MIDKKTLDSLDLSHLDKYLVDSLRGDFYNWAGVEHYRLLNYMCSGLDLVYDIGTHKGSSSIAMSSAKVVKSFDIVNVRLTKNKENIYYSLGEYLTPEILKSDLVLIDIDHSGKREREILMYLLNNDYKGIILLDDIHAFDGMAKLWDEIHKGLKTDLTSIGHYSGTGMVL